METIESMKSPLISDGTVKKRISDQSKNTFYMKQIMENKMSSNKTNSTVQEDNENEVEYDVLKKENPNK
jgi:hypothetical protein